MLHPIYRLASDAERAWTVRPTSRRQWQPTLVIPRELCIFEPVSCKGVRWHELDGFARLQAVRMAPFVRTGANAAVRGQTMMLWFWDEAEIDNILAAANRSDNRWRKLAEPLMLAVPKTTGEFRLGCTGGTDTLTLQEGAIVESHWLAAARLQSAAGSPLLSRPWARERLRTHALLTSDPSDVTTARRAAATLGMVALVALGAYAAHWGGKLYGAERRLALLMEAARASTAVVGDVDQVRQAAARDRAWVEQYTTAGTGLNLNALLAALASPLQAQGVVMKELEMRNDDLRLSLISAGTEIDLPAMLQALEDIPGINDVQVRQNTDPAQATFSMRAGGFRTPLLATSAMAAPGMN